MLKCSWREVTVAYSKVLAIKVVRSDPIQDILKVGIIEIIGVQYEKGELRITQRLWP